MATRKEQHKSEAEEAGHARCASVTSRTTSPPAAAHGKIVAEMPSKVVSVSLGALAIGLVAAGYLLQLQEHFISILPSSILNLLPSKKRLKRLRSKSDLRAGNFDTIEDWLRSKSFTLGNTNLDPQLEQIILRLLTAIEEVSSL